MLSQHPDSHIGRGGMAVPIDYEKLTDEDFDAVVTGEISHYAIWLEQELIGVIADHFVGETRRSDFIRLLMMREGLTFQDKIDIVRAAIPLFPNGSEAAQLKHLLPRIEELKALRNALAHGLGGESSGAPRTFKVELVKRNGTNKTIGITVDSHRRTMSEAEALLISLRQTRSSLNARAEQDRD